MRKLINTNMKFVYICNGESEFQDVNAHYFSLLGQRCPWINILYGCETESVILSCYYHYDYRNTLLCILECAALKSDHFFSLSLCVYKQHSRY